MAALTSPCEPMGSTVRVARRSAGRDPAVRPSWARRAASSLSLALGLFAAVSTAAPFIPTDDAQVLERLPYRPLDPEVRALRKMRTELAQAPGDLDLAVRLARRYIELGKADADPRYFGYAEGALAPWWHAAEPPPTVLVLRATLRQNRHRFPEALQDLDKALAAQPDDAQAWLTRAIILQVRGEYREAMRSCAPLLSLADTLTTVACASGVASLNGRARQSYEALTDALEASPEADVQRRGWAQRLLGEIAARRGDAAAAERHFKEALSLGRKDPYLLAAYADLLLDRNRPADVVALLKRSTRVDGLLLRLALAEDRLRLPEAQRHVALLTARFAEARARGENLHPGDEARFALYLLKDATRALELASANWAVQRQPRDARILIEAALAAGQPGAARPAVAAVRAAGLEDVVLERLVARASTP
jgi:Tfp pilus assembly protein PilF